MTDRPLILFHANCPDGFTAAWVAHRHFDEAADYVPVQYGQPPPDVTGRTVYILDFSYKRGELLVLASKASSLTVLDHHKTAAEDLNGFSDECAQLYGLFPPTVVFDMGKSGARLTWEHFFPELKAPWLVDYTEDRDLWRWTLPDSREINSALSSYPFAFGTWDFFHDHPDLARYAAEGMSIERYKHQQVEAICQNAYEVEMDGHRILAVNTSVQFSEVAGKLAEGRPFGAAWFQRADGKRQWSLRSTDEGVDVSEVAKRRGGGGHRNAAGFQE